MLRRQLTSLCGVVISILQLQCALAQGRPEPESSVCGRAVSVLPNARQLAWQQRDIQALLHFGMNTMTDREWGNGTEDPKLFNPARLDAAQWAQAAQSFGAQSLTMVCKHHDGFCLWPSQFTEHSVKNSPWKGGQGDLVAEVAEACRKAGLKFGVYVSPADLNHQAYGRNSAVYNDYFCNQLQELLSRYGEICEVFLDGAQPSIRHQGYDFPRYYRLIRQLQPSAVITMRGPDARWVGNESGAGRESEWSVLPVPTDPEQYDWPDQVASDLGSRKRLVGAPYLHWHPALAAVSLRRDWFWHPGKDNTIKSLPALVRIYEQTVGRNAVLQLNLSPDRDGRIPEADLNRLQEFGGALQSAFGTNLVAAGKARIDPVVAQDDGTFTQHIAFSSPQPARYVVLQEDITKGQRVEAFEFIATPGTADQKVFLGTTIGWKRIVRLGDTWATDFLLRIKQNRAEPVVSVALY